MGILRALYLKQNIGGNVDIFLQNKRKLTSIDHFHYDVTRAKVSGSCSKDRAQCRAIARKCQKISRSAMSAKASYQVFQKAMCSIAIQIQRNSASSFFFR